MCHFHNSESTSTLEHHMSSHTVHTSKQGSGFSSVGLWVLALAFAVLAIVLSLLATPALIFALFGFLVLPLVFSFWHGARRYGVVGIVIFFLASEIIGNIMENTSIATGFPFGHYHYTSNGIPFLFQVPLTIGLAYFAYGYLGWFLTVYLFFQIFALYRRTPRAKLVTQVPTSYWYQALLVYLFTALSYITGLVIAGHGVIADATGHLWRVHDIYETAVIISLYTMVFPSVLAFVKLLKNKK